MHPALSGLIIDFFYAGPASVSKLFPEVFADAITRPTVTLAVTAVSLPCLESSTVLLMKWMNSSKLFWMGSYQVRPPKSTSKLASIPWCTPKFLGSWTSVIQAPSMVQKQKLCVRDELVRGGVFCFHDPILSLYRHIWLLIHKISGIWPFWQSPTPQSTAGGLCRSKLQVTS